MRQTKAEKLLEQIAFLQEQLAAHQTKCKHPHHRLMGEYGSSAGGWDEPSYWRTIRCDLCKAFVGIFGSDTPEYKMKLGKD